MSYVCGIDLLIWVINRLAKRFSIMIILCVVVKSGAQIFKRTYR